MPVKTLVGLTGGYRTGKTTVLKMFKQLGAKTLDGDRIVKECWRGANSPNKQLRAFLKKDGIINHLNQKIPFLQVQEKAFQNRKFRQQLEKIIHPYVFRKINLAHEREKGILIVEIPLLFETGYDRKTDFNITVATSSTKSIKRAKTGSGISPKEWNLRSGAQWSLRKKREKSDAVIRNEGSLRHTRQQVVNLWKFFNKKENN